MFLLLHIVGDIHFYAVKLDSIIMKENSWEFRKLTSMLFLSLEEVENVSACDKYGADSGAE